MVKLHWTSRKRSLFFAYRTPPDAHQRLSLPECAVYSARREREEPWVAERGRGDTRWTKRQQRRGFLTHSMPAALRRCARYWRTTLCTTKWLVRASGAQTP